MESLSLNKKLIWKGLFEKRGFKKRKILRMILGPVLENAEYQSRHNFELKL